MVESRLMKCRVSPAKHKQLQPIAVLAKPIIDVASIQLFYVIFIIYSTTKFGRQQQSVLNQCCKTTNCSLTESLQGCEKCLSWIGESTAV
jgi:hypothetical protein